MLLPDSQGHLCLPVGFETADCCTAEYRSIVPDGWLACILWFQHGDVRDQLCFAFYGNLGITTESDSDTYCYCRTIDLSDESNCV